MGVRSYFINVTHKYSQDVSPQRLSVSVTVLDCLLMINIICTVCYIRDIGICLVVEILAWDNNFGLKVASWDDVAPTKEEIRVVLSQVHAVCINEPHVFFNYCDIRQYDNVYTAMTDSRYTNIHPFFIHKNNQNCVGYQQYTYAVDVLVVGYYPNKRSVPWNASANPLMRHNIISVPSLNVHYKNPSDNKTANIHEKPAGNMATLMANHASPGPWALVLGAGSGGEVLGAIKAGLHVVAVERDQRQFDGLRARLTQMMVNEEKQKLELAQKKEKQKTASMKKKKSKAKIVSSSNASPAADDQVQSRCPCCGVDETDVDTFVECQVCQTRVHRGCALLSNVIDGVSEEQILTCSQSCMDSAKA